MTIHWSTIDPKDAADLDLSVRLDIEAPLNEQGERCPWPWEPQQLVGAPMGQYHCPWCEAMVVAGVPHLDYRERPHEEHDGTDPGCLQCAEEADRIDPGTWPHAATRPDAVAAVAAAMAEVIDSVRAGGGSARGLALLAVETLAMRGSLPAAEEEWLVTYTVTDLDGSKPLVYDVDRSESAHGTFGSRADAERHVAAWKVAYRASMVYRDVRYHRRTSWTHEGPWLAVE